MNLLIYAIIFNIPLQTQGVAWRRLEFGFKKRKTGTKAEKLGSWLNGLTWILESELGLARITTRWLRSRLRGLEFDSKIYLFILDTRL
jgi:hypothetical protein